MSDRDIIGYFGGAFLLVGIAAAIVVLAIAILIPLSGKMRDEVFATFDAHPVPGIERRKEKTIDCPVCKRPTTASDAFVCLACSIKICPHCGNGNKGVVASKCDKCGKLI